MKRSLTFLISGAVLVACAGSKVIQMPQDVVLPGGWNKLSNGTFNLSQCPQMAGKYIDAPEKVSTPDSPFFKTDLEDLTFMGVMPFHLAEKEVISKATSGQRSKIFELSQESAESFSVRFENLKSENIRYRFNTDAVRYQCRSGLVYFPVVGRFGADQTGSYNVQYQQIMGTDVDGNLILVRISGPYRLSPQVWNKDFQFDYYRYPKIE